jgi:hypothetical protein
MMNSTSRRAARCAALVAVTLLSAACGTKEAPDPLSPSGTQGRIRFVNLITDTTRGRVNAILELVPFGVNLTYTQSTPATLPSPATALYSPILSGSRSLVLKRTLDTNTVVGSYPITITEGQDRTMYAIGGTGGSAVTTYITTDDNTLPTTATNARVRLVHLSPTAGAVDVFITATGADLSTATPTVSNVSNQSASSYVTLAAGTYQVRAVPAGTAPASRAAAVSITASITLTGNTVRTIVAADNNVGGAPLRAFVLSDR